MGAITRKQIITDSALEAPLELGANFGIAEKEAKQLLSTLDRLSSTGKKVDANLDLAKTTKEVSNETKDLSSAQQELEKIDKRIAIAQVRQNSEFIKKEKQLKGIRSETKKLINEEERMLGEEEKLIKSNKALLEQRRKLIKTDETYVDQVAEINNKIQENSAKILENGTAQEKQRSQIGAYREQLEGLGVTVGSISGQGGAIIGFFSKLSGGIDAGTKASLRFIATPLGAVIAAIVAGIALLTAAVTNNQKSADDFNRIWGGITEVLDEVFSRVVRLGAALGKFIQGDFSGAANEASAAFDNLSSSLGRAFIEGRKLVQLNIDLEKSTISATVATAALQGEIELLDIILGNNAKSFKEREVAGAKAREKQIELAKINIDLAQQELNIINIQVSAAVRRGTINRELQQQQADGLAKLIEANDRGLAVEAKNQLELDILKQDRLERDLDILIDGFDNVKMINERIINDDKRTIRNRREGFDELKSLGEKSFDAQIGIIRKFTNVAFDENELLQEQDAVILNQKIRALGTSEIIEGRILEIIRDRRTAIKDFAEIEETLQQASIDRLQQIADNEKNITEDRINALLELGTLRLTILDNQLQKGIVNEQEFSDKTLEIQEKLADDIAQLQLQRFDDAFSDAQIDADTARINQLIDLNEDFRSGEIESEEEFERRKLEIQAEGNRASLLAQLDFFEERKKLLKNAGVDTSAIDKSIAEIRLKLSERTGDKLVDNEAEVQELINGLKQEAFNATLSIIDSFNEREDEKRSDRIDVLNEQEEQALAAAGDNEEKKQQIQIDFATKRKAIEDEQARADRRRAIFEKTLAATEIAIVTAVAVAKAVKANPVLLGLPQSALVAAIGAVQLAAVLASPIPAFMTGVKSAPSGLKMINEEPGGEAWVTPSGELRYAGDTGAIVVGDDVIPQGSEIFTASETAKMMANPIDFGKVSGVGYSDKNRSPENELLNNGMRALLRQGQENTRVLKNKKEYHLNISKHATDKLTKTGENWVKILNSEYR